MDNLVILALFVFMTLTLSQEDRVTFLPGYGAIPNDTVYAGNIPIANGKRSGTMFYLFFETSNVDKTVPIVLWLNGGPRCSSLLGAFEEQVSPFYLDDEGKLFRNPYGWNKAAHVLFVDNPIGTGFSTVDNDASYAV
jgi:carboxypeptidase C (cathepsin A)